MHPSLVKFIGDSSPDLNMDLALGLPRIHMRDTVQYVRKVIESAIKSAPPCFVFDDIRKADPVENYYGSLKGRPKHRKTSRSKEKNVIKTSGTKTYDTSRTDFFLTYLQFSTSTKKLASALPWSRGHCSCHLWDRLVVYSSAILAGSSLQF